MMFRDNNTEEYTQTEEYEQQTIEDFNVDLEPYEEEEPETAESRMAPKTKALFLFFAAVAVFVCSVGMCLMLMARSADVTPLPAIKHINPMKYEVHLDQPENPDRSDEFTPPASKNESDLVNILVLAVDEDKSETFMILSINMTNHSLSLISFPRDTYVFGDYEVPAMRSIYTAHLESGRAVQALVEKVKEQVGFAPDYYMVLDQSALDTIFEITGDIELDVPQYPSYSGLDGGVQDIGSWSAMRLLSCKSSYYYVESESTEVQRNLLIAMLAALTQRMEDVDVDMSNLKNTMDTDLSFDNLAYLMYFFRRVDFNSVASICLPGVIINVDGEEFYQINRLIACDILNAYCNPLKTELTEYNVAFRQQQGASDEGEWEQYKDYYTNNTKPTSNNTRPTTTTNNNDPEPTEHETETPTPPTMPDGPDTPHEDP